LLKKRLNLRSGLLEVTELWDGKILLGELRYGQALKTELRDAIYIAGYHYGILDSSLDMLEKGHHGQIPIALTSIEEDPGKVRFHFEDSLNDGNINSWIKSGNFSSVNFLYPVNKGDKLLSIIESPYRFIRYPTGQKKVVGNLSDGNISTYCGENTGVDVLENVIVSESDGYAHRTIYGQVSVYTGRTLKNIGKMHGDVEFDNCLIVEQDIRSRSSVTLPSNLKVCGLIRSALVHVAGNIHSEFGMDNSEKVDSAKIYAGQSIMTSYISHYSVWAGTYIVAQKSISYSEVHCMNSLVSPVISGSEIYVGGRLFVRDVIKGSQIYLGPEYVVDPGLKRIKNYNRQHEKKLFDLFMRLEEHQREIEFAKKKAMGHLAKLRRFSNASISSDMLLNRFYKNMRTSLDKLKNEILQCEKALQVFEDEKRQLVFYDAHANDRIESEIIITGKIESGCAIYASHQTFRVHETLEHISVKLNMINGTLSIAPIEQTLYKLT